MGEWQGSAKHPKMHGTALTAKSHLAQNVNSAAVEKCCSKEVFFQACLTMTFSMKYSTTQTHTHHNTSNKFQETVFPSLIHDVFYYLLFHFTFNAISDP